MTYIDILRLSLSFFQTNFILPEENKRISGLLRKISATKYVLSIMGGQKQRAC